jgi:hypothetical protein
VNSSAIAIVGALILAMALATPISWFLQHGFVPSEGAVNSFSTPHTAPGNPADRSSTSGG